MMLTSDASHRGRSSWPAAVFFDLDNTLIHRRQSLERYAEHFVVEFGSATSGPADLRALTDCIVRADAGGYLPAGSVYGTIKEAVAHAVSAMPEWHSVPVAHILDHWTSHLPSSSVAMPGAVELIDALVSHEVHVGVISNGAEHSRMRSLQALPFSAKVSQLLSSGALGIRKPDPQIFRLAAQRAGCAVEACWFIGDHPINDVEGALAAGMSAIWLRGFHDWPHSMSPHEHAVDNLDGVRDILAGAARQ